MGSENKKFVISFSCSPFRVYSPYCSMLHCLRLAVVSDGQTNILYCVLKHYTFKVPLEMGIKAIYVVSSLTLEG